MGKHEWFWRLDDALGELERADYRENPLEYAQVYALLAMAERLEALVAIGDALEEVSDLWANTLSFGGQPVGGVEQPASAMRGEWMCDYSAAACVLMKGHNGVCVSPVLRTCQCMKPDFDFSSVCIKCGFLKKETDAAPA